MYIIDLLFWKEKKVYLKQKLFLSFLTVSFIISCFSFTLLMDLNTMLFLCQLKVISDEKIFVVDNQH